MSTTVTMTTTVTAVPATATPLTYHEALHKIADKSKHPLLQLTTLQGKKVTVALRHGGSPKPLCQAVRDQHGCNACVSRAKQFGRLSLINKKGGAMPLFMISPTLLDDSYTPIATANGNLCMTPIVGLSVLQGEYVGGFAETEGACEETGEPFHHYHIRIPEDKRTEVDAAEAKLLERAFQRYCPSLLPTILNTLLPKEGPGTREDKIARIKKALQIAESALLDVVYGDRVAPGVRWLLRVVEYFEREGRLPHERTPAQRWMLCAEMLLWTQIHPDGMEGKSAVSPVIQQAHGNVIPLLDKATSRSAMISMLSARVDPRSYQRPTAAPTLGQVQNAISALGDFSTRILTHDEAATLPRAIRLGPSTGKSSMGAFQDMLTAAATATSKKNPAGFAGRCSDAIINTVTDLLQALRADLTQRLEVRVTGMPDVYVASTTLDAAKLCVPHLWAYTGSHGGSTYFPDEWSEVAVVNPLCEYVATYKSVLFFPKNVRPPRTLGNCCFPEFLEPGIRRPCRSAFEDMNRRVPLSIDVAQKTVALGVGVCATNERGELRTPLRVRLEGREYTLSRL